MRQLVHLWFQIYKEKRRFLAKIWEFSVHYLEFMWIVSHTWNFLGSFDKLHVIGVDMFFQCWRCLVTVRLNLRFALLKRRTAHTILYQFFYIWIWKKWIIHNCYYLPKQMQTKQLNSHFSDLKSFSSNGFTFGSGIFTDFVCSQMETFTKSHEFCFYFGKLKSTKAMNKLWCIFIIGIDDVVTQSLTDWLDCCHLAKSPLMIRIDSIVLLNEVQLKIRFFHHNFVLY